MATFADISGGDATAAISGGLRGLLEAYKIRLGEAQEEAKVRQSGFNAYSGAAINEGRLAALIQNNLENQRLRQEANARFDDQELAREIEIGGVRYLSRKGSRGQPVLTPVINQKGSASQAEIAEGNIASITQAPEYLKALREVPGGNVGIRATQTPVIGSLFGMINSAAARAREKRKAFITPYLSSGGGKALTAQERKIFEGRVSESSMLGDSGVSTQGIKDLVKEIAGKTGSAIETRAMGPATGQLRARLNAAVKSARAGGALDDNAGDSEGWQPTIYKGSPARRRRTSEGAWEVEY